MPASGAPPPHLYVDSPVPPAAGALVNAHPRGAVVPGALRAAGGPNARSGQVSRSVLGGLSHQESRVIGAGPPP